MISIRISYSHKPRKGKEGREGPVADRPLRPRRCPVCAVRPFLLRVPDGCVSTRIKTRLALGSGDPKLPSSLRANSGPGSVQGITYCDTVRKSAPLRKRPVRQSQIATQIRGTLLRSPPISNHLRVRAPGRANGASSNTPGPAVDRRSGASLWLEGFGMGKPSRAAVAKRGFRGAWQGIRSVASGRPRESISKLDRKRARPAEPGDFWGGTSLAFSRPGRFSHPEPGDP